MNQRRRQKTTNRVYVCKYCKEGFATALFIERHLHEHGTKITGFINENNYQQHYDLVKRSTFLKEWRNKKEVLVQ